jgi:hypothetical protein
LIGVSLVTKKMLLGLPGPWAEEPNEVADHYTTKIGGTLDWPVPLLKIDLDMLLKCGICGNYLALVAQVHSSYHIPLLCAFLFLSCLLWFTNRFDPAYNGSVI